jgi:hypothetical protein
MIEDNINHTIKLAEYIYDQDVQHIDYADHCDHGKNPQVHVLYSAATVLGIAGENGFHADYESWYDKQSTKRNKQAVW